MYRYLLTKSNVYTQSIGLANFKKLQILGLYAPWEGKCVYVPPIWNGPDS